MKFTLSHKVATRVCLRLFAFMASFSIVSYATPAAAQRRSGGSVRVRGYVRRDGTYVSPHYRSSPDGSFSNNWSTTGNVNPYTGEAGTKNVPPTTYRYGSSLGTSSGTPSSPPHLDLPTRTPKKSNSSLFPPPSQYTFDDTAMRTRKAADLKRLGIEVNASEHSWLELSDMEMRVRKAKDLSRLGLEVKWQEHSWLEMSDWQMRMTKAKDLKRLGIDLDWQKHTWLEMSDQEMRIRKAKDLERLGVSANWREHTWLEMSEMEYKARKL